MRRAPAWGVVSRAALGIAAAVALFGCGAAAAEAPPAGDALEQIEAAQLFHLGSELGERGDSIRAEQYLAAAMERGYPEAEVIPRLMEVCIGASRLSAALGYAEPYLARHDSDWALRLLVATLQMTLQQAEAARGNLERVIADRPEEASSHYLLGVLLRDRYASTIEANDHFARYLELAPEGPHAREARLSLDGRYVPPAAPAEAAPHDEPPAPPPGPTRMPSHDTESDTAGPRP
jgi:tetratricopeptide (TPR) repeat protein